VEMGSIVVFIDEFIAMSRPCRVNRSAATPLARVPGHRRRSETGAHRYPSS
jgi:hypothetical protein